jgi:hypothetical protein
MPRRPLILILTLILILSLSTLATGCGAYINARYPLTPLAAAARAGNVDEIDNLLDAGADINAGSGVNGWSPVMHALHKRQVPALVRLLDRGARLDERAAREAMTMAAGYGDAEAVRALLSRGVVPPSGVLQSAVGGAWDIDYRWSGCQRHIAVTRALLDRNPQLRLDRGVGDRLAIMWARWKGCEDLVRLVS